MWLKERRVWQKINDLCLHIKIRSYIFNLSTGIRQFLSRETSMLMFVDSLSKRLLKSSSQMLWNTVHNQCCIFFFLSVLLCLLLNLYILNICWSFAVICTYVQYYTIIIQGLFVNPLDQNAAYENLTWNLLSSRLLLFQ